MKRRRVKITGIGPVTPAGIGREAFWKGILEPVSRVRQFTGLPKEYGELVGAYIADFAVERYFESRRVPKGASRQTEFALAGTALALTDAGITEKEIRGIRTAVVTGSCLMDFGALTDSFNAVSKRGPRAAPPRNVHTAGIGSVSAAISTAFGLTDRSFGVSNQCSSGMDAISLAALLVATGEADLAICGGTDAAMFQTPFLEMRAGKWVTRSAERAERQVRPFDLWRTTSALAEGCAILVLESEASPRKGYSWIAGQGFAGDGEGESCTGLAEAARVAMADARLRPHDVDVLNLWGPGDTHVDRCEASAMRSVFGLHLDGIAAHSIKGSVGSALGAAPAIQIAAAAIAQCNSCIPPTVNWQFPDPECPLPLSSQRRSIDHRITLVNSHGVTAVNGCVVLVRC